MNQSERLQVLFLEVYLQERSADLKLPEFHGQELEIRTLVRDGADPLHIFWVDLSHGYLPHEGCEVLGADRRVS